MCIKNVYHCGKKKLRGSFGNFAEVLFIQKFDRKSASLHVFVFINGKADCVAVIGNGFAFAYEFKIVVGIEVGEKYFRAAVGVDFGYVRRVAIGEQSAIHHCSADYVNVVLVVFFDFGKQLVNGLYEDIAFGVGVGLFSVWVENDIYAVFEGHTVRKRQKGIAAHYDHFTARMLDEMAHIRFEIEEQIVLFAQSPFVIDCKYSFHIVP